MSHDFLWFFLAWLAATGRVGAVAPSGNVLAELMTGEIGPAIRPVLELGPGTGKFTDKIVKRGVLPRELTLIEFGSEFVKSLQVRFLGSRVVWMDATKMRSSGLFQAESIGAVVSGLPLLNMSPRKVLAILDGAFTYLRPGGAFYQFTYGVKCPVRRPILDRLGLKATLVDSAILNVPPAAVYRVTRRAERRLRPANIGEKDASCPSIVPASGQDRQHPLRLV